MREVLAETDPATREEIRKRICRAMVAKALKGDTNAAEFVAQRTDGKVEDRVKLTDRRDELVRADPTILLVRLRAAVKKLEGGPGGGE